MGLSDFGAEDIPYLNTTDDKGIADKRAVAAPGDRLGAHDGGTLLLGQVDKFCHGRGKLRCLHVICEAAEGSIMPAGVGGIGAGVAQPSQLFHVPVTDAAVTEELAQRVEVELWVMPGTGDCSHIHQTLDAVSSQQPDKIVEAVSRMPHSIN